MKLKNTILASTLLSLLAGNAFAAQELTPEKAAELKPFERINITGRFNAINDAADAVSKRADELGAASYYIQGINDSNGNSGNWRVTADLYKADAPKANDTTTYRVMNGVKELPKAEAFRLEPFDTVSVSGFFASQPDVNDAISKAAKEKGAASFFIVRQVDANNGGNQYVTAYVYKADAKERKVQSPNLIPDSEAGKAALAAGGEAAKRVEIPGVASSETPSSSVGRFFETQSSTGQRYTVKLANGQSIQEVNAITAAQMQPFDTVTFTGHFGTPTEISEEVAKRAADKGAKFYHVTRQWQNQSGGNLTVTADLFK